MKIIFLILFYISIITVCKSIQEYDIDIIGKEAGLYQSIIKCGLEDSRGFLWIGTSNGINRYDGKEFVVFKHIHNDSTSISENSILSIAEDKKGYIWILNENSGIDKLDPNTGKSNSYKIDFDEKSQKLYKIYFLFSDNNGQIYLIATFKQNSNGQPFRNLYRYNYKSDKFHIFNTGINKIDSVIKDTDNNFDIYVGSDGQFFMKTDKLINLKNNKWKIRRDELIIMNPQYNEYKILGQFEDYEFVKILGLDENNNLLIQVSNDNEAFKVIKLILSYYTFQKTNYRIDKKWYKNDYSLNIFYFQDKLYATVKKFNLKVNKSKNDYNGFYQFDDTGYLEFNKKLRIHSFSPVHFAKGFLEANKLLSPKNNLIWDFYNSAIIKIKPKTKLINNHRNLKTDLSTISHNTIRSVYCDSDDNLWVGSFNGLNKYDKPKNKWIKYFYNKNSLENRKNNINVITEDNNNNLILGTNRGILYLDKKNGQLIDYLKIDIETYNVWGLLYVHNNLWIGDYRGLFRYSTVTDSIKIYQHNDTILNSLSDSRISTIYKDTKGNIWVGTLNGLNKYLPEIDGFKVYLNKSSDINSICGNVIWSVCEDKTGNLWFGAYGVGISKYNPKSDNFTSLTSAYGLPDDGISSMVCDNDNNLWLGSMNGLIKYNQKNGKFIRYSENDGFQSDEYSFNSAAITRDGNLVFGGSNGISVFSPNDLKINKYIPDIVISKLFLGDSLVSYFLQNGDTISKKWNEDYLKIQFSVMDFTAPLLNQYAFKIDGIHDNWIELGNQNSIILAGIEPGEYILRLKGSNNDGIWNNKGIALHLSIVPPYWKTVWFKILLFSTVIIILISITGYFLWQSRMKGITKKKIISLQLKALQTQMNPHFIFNSLNAILNLIVQDDKHRAMLYLSRFSKLLRKIIERSRASSITLEEEIEHIKLYLELELLRYEDKFKYSLEIDENIDIEETIVPALFLQPYIENSIKHGNIHQIENGRVDIQIKESSKELNIFITDNGIGRKKAVNISNEENLSHKSLGMEISKETLSMINSEVIVTDLSDANGFPNGTKIAIIIYNYREQNGHNRKEI
ncbi:MAG: two-component regulator propeller domain-containing protein [Candidatus Kapabacteria bacterium]|nr:two-component regulator propeller domain-containing protein [Candidatus Kapabacteria bacterium]